MSTTPAPGDNEEMRKCLVSFALAGDSLICIDNVAGAFGWPSLDMALTSGRLDGRVLGVNRTIDVNMATAFYATGNNPTYVGDVVRRVLRIRVETKDSRPEMRSGFKYPDLPGHVREQRAALVGAVLSVLRGYCAEGRPKQKMDPWGSYDAWSSLVRGAIIWAGFDDPAANRKDFAEQADTTRVEVLRPLLVGLRTFMPAGAKWTTAEIRRGSEADDLDKKGDRGPRLSVDERQARKEIREALAAAVSRLGGESHRFTGQKLSTGLKGLLTTPCEFDEGGRRRTFRLRKVDDKHAGQARYWAEEVKK